jgi:hypothetical protein
VPRPVALACATLQQLAVAANSTTTNGYTNGSYTNGCYNNGCGVTVTAVLEAIAQCPHAHDAAGLHSHSSSRRASATLLLQTKADTTASAAANLSSSATGAKHCAVCEEKRVHALKMAANAQHWSAWHTLTTAQQLQQLQQQQCTCKHTATTTGDTTSAGADSDHDSDTAEQQTVASAAVVTAKIAARLLVDWLEQLNSPALSLKVPQCNGDANLQAAELAAQLSAQPVGTVRTVAAVVACLRSLKQLALSSASSGGNDTAVLHVQATYTAVCARVSAALQKLPLTELQLPVDVRRREYSVLQLLCDENWVPPRVCVPYTSIQVNQLMILMSCDTGLSCA